MMSLTNPKNELPSNVLTLKLYLRVVQTFLSFAIAQECHLQFNLKSQVYFKDGPLCHIGDNKNLFCILSMIYSEVHKLSLYLVYS